MSRFAGIVIEAPLTKVYHYRVPERLADRVRVGVRVEAPFGPRRVHGYCVELNEDCPIDEKRCKELAGVGPVEERVEGELLELTRWIASYYHTGWGTVLAAALPSAIRKETGARKLAHVALAMDQAEALAAAEAIAKRAPKQAAALRWLIQRLPEGGSLPAALVEAEAGVTRAVLKGLAGRGCIAMTLAPVAPEGAGAGSGSAGSALHLTEEQEVALGALLAALDQRTFAPFLLYGITGSGKTEVYLQALTHTLAQGRSCLVLVPEISLTPQTVARFEARAGEVAVLHSNLAAGEKAEAWRRMRRGEVRVAVGARSCVFAPLTDLGLVIVDEEHEPSFKQDNDPRYHARDVAVMRAKLAGAVAVLGSATPSLESWRNAGEGKYALLSLRHRPGGARPPVTSVVDMRKEQAEAQQATIYSRSLLAALHGALGRGEQGILLLNRRGFHTVAQCMGCGEALRCRDCDIALTWHRAQELLRCHYCDFACRPPATCPLCGSPRMRYGGTGTERAVEILGRLLPEARLLRMDSDTMNRRDAHATALAAFGRGEYDILLGTQMIAKGLDFPNVTVVGVLSADSAIDLPDVRAAERCFQLITQVVGRSGRGERPGEAIIQAYQPEHHAVQCAVAQDYQDFARVELEERKGMGYPPWGRLARLVARGPEEAKVKTVLAEATVAVREHAKRPLTVLGPAPCALTRIQGEYRYHTLIKVGGRRELTPMLAALDEIGPRTKGVRLTIDIDPVAML